MSLSYLPTLKVYIAFNPTATVGGTTYTLDTAMTAPLTSAYWTEVSIYCIDYTTKSGKQHYLDRMEAATLTMTLNGRDGYFLNGTTNGTGYVITPRMPIAITNTYSSVTYSTFFGVIESIDEKITDELNVDLVITASDYTKHLSLTYLHSPAFWNTYAAAQATSLISWYRCNNLSATTVTSAVGNGSTIVYQAVNQYKVGQHVTITGLGGLTTLNQANAAITAVTSSSFTISAAVTAVSSGTGTAYNTDCQDYFNTYNGQYQGSVSYPTHGAIIYDADGCVDLANGTQKGSGSIQLNTYSTTQGALDLWVLGQAIAGTVITTVLDGSGATTLKLQVSASGQFEVFDATTHYSSNVIVNDGYWHHVGIVSDSSGILHVFADGTFSAMGSYTGWKTSSNLVIGGALNAQVDEICISSASSLSTLVGEVQTRYRAGSLLQTGFPVTSNKISSGQRIAEILAVAGYAKPPVGTTSNWGIAGGTLTNKAFINLIPNLFYIFNAYRSGAVFNDGSANQGYASTEPYYWDSPVYNSTALDLILQITDTDIGLFYQHPNGTFNFFDQNYYGTWAFTQNTPPTAPTTSWTPAYTHPTSAQAWTDDNSGAVIYDGPSLQVTRDDTDIYETVRITPQSGIDQIYENTNNEPRWGQSTLLKSSTVNASLNDALSTAYFLGHLFKTPLTRVQNVDLHAETNTANNLPAMLGTHIGDVVLFKRTPPGAATSADSAGIFGYVFTDMAVESISHSFQADPGQLITSFTLDPYPVRS